MNAEIYATILTGMGVVITLIVTMYILATNRRVDDTNRRIDDLRTHTSRRIDDLRTELKELLEARLKVA